MLSILFFFNDTATTEIYTLSLHDALPISTLGSVGARRRLECLGRAPPFSAFPRALLAEVAVSSTDLFARRSEEHTSELQSPCNLVCRLLLEKKKKRLIVRANTKTRDPPIP